MQIPDFDELFLSLRHQFHGNDVIIVPDQDA